jgi:hypothetical protein
MKLMEWIEEQQRAIYIDRSKILMEDLRASKNCADMADRRVEQIEEALLSVDELLWPGLLEVEL